MITARPAFNRPAAICQILFEPASPGGTARTCELASGDDRFACVRGVVYALVDNTWDGRYALPFCAALSQTRDQESCFRDGVQYVSSVYDKPAAEIVRDCSRYAADSTSCAEAAAR